MPFKSFDYCPKKAAFRKECVINPISKMSGRIHDNLMILETAGRYSDDIRATSYYQYLKSGIIKGSSQFLGVDDESKCGETSIVGDNIERYGQGKKWFIPCECDKIQNACYKYRESVGFINLDLQAMCYNCYHVLKESLMAMEGVNQKFGVCFNSIFETPWCERQRYVPKDGTVQESMAKFLNKMQDDNYLKKRLDDFIPVSWFWYDGTDKSSTILGAYVFWSK